jgi:hypothetical protein
MFTGSMPHMSFEDYRAAPGVANSDLKIIAQRSPAHFYAARLDPDREPEKPTAAKTAGSALHCALLEPEAFDRTYAYVPDDAPRDLRHLRNAAKPSPDTVRAIEWWDRFESDNAGRVIIPRAVSDDVRRCADRMRLHPELRPYLEAPGHCEESVFATDPETGELCKVRNDKRLELGGFRVILDLKSCDDVRANWFQRAALNFGYFQGCAFYRDVNTWAGHGPIDVYLLVAFEREAPNALKIYEVAPDAEERGREQYRRALAIYKHCREMHDWPSYPTDIAVLEYPAWARD